MPGTVYDGGPWPLEPDDTRWVPAGPVTFGVEYRDVVGPGVDNYADYQAGTLDAADATAFSDEGISVHVFGTEDEHEYLRFDMFEDTPHYHYIRPSGDHNHYVEYDPVADGDMLSWALDIDRLRAMLTEADGLALARQLDDPAVLQGIAEVKELANDARSTPA